VVLATATAVVALRQRPDAVPPTGGDRVAAGARTDGARQLLRRLSGRLERGSLASVRALAPPGDRSAAGELGMLRHNVRALRMTLLSLRLAGTPDPSTEEAGATADGRSWTAEVQVRWRLAADGAADSRTRVPVRFRQVDGRTRFAGLALGSPDADRRQAVPLWVLGRVSVARAPRALVVSAVPGASGRFAPLADRAVLDVRRVLRRWPGRVVVEVPRDQRQLDRVLGAPAGTYAAIAAVTGTADGSTHRDAPAHVFVNPRVFDPLGPRGSQVVMTHETTHVAMRAALSPMPVWLLEGFADYVALAHADLPVSRVASQTLSRVRRTGPPERLPTRRDFGPHSPQLGASYESAWLACRLVAQRYGERRLVAFYRASDRAGATAEAFRSVLGTDQQAFTRAWRTDLRRLARSASQ